MGNCCCCCGQSERTRSSVDGSSAYGALPPGKSSSPGKVSGTGKQTRTHSGTIGETPLSPRFSVLSGDEYHDCNEECFSVDGDDAASRRAEAARSSPSTSSPPHSARLMPHSDGGIKEPLKAHQSNGAAAHQHASAFQQAAQVGSPFRSEAGGAGPSGISDTSEEPMAPSAPPTMFKLSGCLTLLGSIGLHGDGRKDKDEAGGGAQGAVRTSRKAGGKPEAGCSVQRRDDAGCSFTDARDMWGEASAPTFMVRSLDYMRSKQKVNSGEAIYQLVGVDLFSFQHKQTHIAKHVTLPAPAPQRHVSSPETYLPPLLVVNIMLPLYPPSFFGGTNDGAGHSIVYYFALPEDFDPLAQPNAKAMGLLRRFVQGGREADGTPTRDRLKLVPRIVNVEEWAAKGPLSATETKLLGTYNDKPLLTRPQQHFFSGHNYLEVDLDVHAYAFLARKALMAFLTRLREVVFENALVIQGNSSDELPEQILGCARLYRFDFERMRPFEDFMTQPPPPPPATLGHGVPPAIPEGAPHEREDDDDA